MTSAIDLENNPSAAFGFYQAMELLAAGDANVTETVAAIGFDSLSAFITAFRSFTGETPAQYRRRFL